MSESNLSLGYPDFAKEVGHFLGYGASSANWTADQIAEIDRVIQSGLRQFYFPPVLQGENEAHKWSFFEPTTFLTCITPYDTGTVSSSGTTVTLATGTWPTWAATNGTLIVSGTRYEISSRTSGSIIELTTAPVVAFSSDEYSLEHDGFYTLPDNFGGIESPLTYDVDQWYEPIQIISEYQIRQFKQIDVGCNPPKYAAITPVISDGSNGERFQIELYPLPDDTYKLTYKYMALANMITSILPYPAGGLPYSETILESCLAVAETRMDDSIGLHNQLFLQRLKRSILDDRENGCPDLIGYNSDKSDSSSDFRHPYTRKLVAYEDNYSM